MFLIYVPDNDYEIGEEPEITWGWNKFKGKPRRRNAPSSKVSGWISKRKKLNGIIEQCSDIFKKAGYGGEMKTTSEATFVLSEKVSMCCSRNQWAAIR